MRRNRRGVLLAIAGKELPRTLPQRFLRNRRGLRRHLVDRRRGYRHQIGRGASFRRRVGVDGGPRVRPSQAPLRAEPHGADQPDTLLTPRRAGAQPGTPVLPLARIHPSAWKDYSPKYTVTSRTGRDAFATMHGTGTKSF